MPESMAMVIGSGKAQKAQIAAAPRKPQNIFAPPPEPAAGREDDDEARDIDDEEPLRL